MMISVNAVHSQAEAHRHDLMASAGTRRIGSVQHKTTQPAAQRSVAGFPVTGGRAVRRPIAPRVGTWLIEFGTRLGGASVRTS
jgi:hypothetical protein